MYKLLVSLFLAMIALICEAQNPFMQENFNTPFETVPFLEINHAHFMPAIEAALKSGREDIQNIIQNPSKPDFQNTIVALEMAGKNIPKVTKVLFHLNSSEKTSEVQQVVKDATPLLTEYRNDISLNPDLFGRVKYVWDNRGSMDLDNEDAMLLEKTYKSFSRNGANLNEAQKNRLREINKRLSDLSISFSDNVLNATNEYQLHITEQKDLAGLPDFVKEAAALTAKRAGMEGWVFTLQIPSYSPFLKYADSRALREKIFRAYASRASGESDYKNTENIYEITALRHEKARLLGYNTWAEYILEERMANSEKIVFDFLNGIKNKALPVAQREMSELYAYAKSQGFEGSRLERWDQSYYTEKLMKEKFSINDEVLKPYFKLENVLQGLFDLTTELFGLSFKRNDEIQGWHEDVVAYEVYDQSGKLMAIWYGDYFPRPGKRSGAWNNTLRGQWVENGVDYRPHVVNVCNFSKPTEDKPSLLTHYEVVVLFHEFGHALHDMLAEGKYTSISGTSVAWDFVELPSQWLQNYVMEPEILQRFATHYETNEPIPAELVEKIKASSTFMQGMATVRQLSLGLLDMGWHSADPSGKKISDLEAQADLTAQFFPPMEGFSVSNTFSHIFAGGYSAGYYSYKWAEVLDADAFEYFRENGLVNPRIAQSFRENILSKGGSEKPMDLYIKFRGREPLPDAMLRRSGLMGE
jgi:peptidyl-dipeptidase Dcp